MRRVPTYALYGEDGGGNADFWLHCETIPARSRQHHWEIGRHRHESFFQILHIQAGSGDAIFQNAAHVFAAPAVIAVPRGIEHGFRFSRDIDGLVITIVAGHAGVSGHAGFAVPRVTQLGEDAPSRQLAQTLRRLGGEFAAERPGRTQIMDAYLGAALVLLARLSDPAGATGPTSENQRRIELLRALVHRHCREHRSAGFYAAALGLSPTHLNRIVRAATGGGTQDLILGKLLEEAKRDLLFTAVTVQSIGLRLGFADPAYFSRFFTRRTGRTPGDWRRFERSRLAGRAQSSV